MNLNVRPRSLGRHVSAASLFRLALVALAITPPLVIASQYLDGFGRPDSLQRPFSDALTYLAAGDRLNSGHDLYRAGPEDLPVDLFPQVYSVPLVGPPPIAIVWRPLALVEFGVAIWMVACWAALLGAITYLVRRVGILAVGVTILLALPIGEQLAAGNVASFFPALLIVAWRGRDGPIAGIAVGVMAAAKLAPIALVGWIIGTRRRVPAAAFVATLMLIAVASLVAVGLPNILDYQLVIAAVDPSPLSFSSQLGFEWASYLLLSGGALLSITTAGWPRVSFAVGVIAMTLGTPGLHTSGLVALLGLVVPLTDLERVVRPRLLYVGAST